ncbi:MAG: MFS transporter [Steroidobacteraceae bacterium]
MLHGLPVGIWGLGLTSMFMDISSELVHSLLPVFMASVLGASMMTIGLIEGIAEATASITKLFSGTLSDRWGRRRPLLLVGYGLAAVTKPVFPLASSIAWVAAARFLDRVGKGIRGAPRDALVADITPVEVRGAAYGLRQALDSFGAAVGPLLAIVCMVLLSGNIKAVLWVGVAPAFIAVLLLVLMVREPASVPRTPGLRSPLGTAGLRRLGARFWYLAALGALFTMARFSEAFLVLRAQQAGLSVTLVPLVMVVMNVVYASAAYPAGRAADGRDARVLLILGLAVLVIADMVLARARSASLVLAGAAIWGLHMALTQGLFSKLVADVAPAGLRGTAFGVFNLVTGIAMLVASTVAGILWSHYGYAATFVGGAVFAALTAVGVLFTRLHVHSGD